MKGREIQTSSNAPAYAEQKKNLGLVELIAIGVGGMIGGGIFSILGLAVEISGHAAPFSFLIGTVIALMAGYSYVRLALTYHSDGASFTYLEKAFPNMLTIAGIAGWTVVIGYIGTLSLYAFTFGAYSSHLFGLNHLPHVRMLFSCGILLLFLGINLLGSSTMGKVEDIAVYIKISMLALLAAVGFYTVDSSRLRPLFDHGASSVFLGGALIFVAFEGFQLITNAVCETRDPARNIPRGLYGSIGITSVIYFIIALVAVGNLDVSAIHAAKEYALAAVAKPILGTFGVVLVDVAAMLATASAINATIFGASHLTYEISHDNLAPKAFSFRTKSGVPAASAVVITMLAVALTALGSLEVIASFSSLTFLLVSIGVCVANLRLREETRTAIIPVILGIILMATTVFLLVYYLVVHNIGAFYFALSAYISIGFVFMTFRLISKTRRTTD